MCSACAAHGTDWMFFCSREHQKLVSQVSSYVCSFIVLTLETRYQVWYMHKRVCGYRSSPFRWPGLNEDEIEENVRLCTEPVVLVDSMPPTTWLDIAAVKFSWSGSTEERLGHFRASLFQSPIFRCVLTSFAKSKGSPSDLGTDSGWRAAASGEMLAARATSRARSSNSKIFVANDET